MSHLTPTVTGTPCQGGTSSVQAVSPTYGRSIILYSQVTQWTGMPAVQVASPGWQKGQEEPPAASQSLALHAEGYDQVLSFAE